MNIAFNEADFILSKVYFKPMAYSIEFELIRIEIDIHAQYAKQPTIKHEPVKGLNHHYFELSH